MGRRRAAARRRGSLLRRLSRWLTRAVAVAVLLLAVLATGLWLWLRTSLPQLDGVATVVGIEGEAEILRDEAGVPFIRAASERDAMFALGWVHAQDRFTQMELMRRLGSGRLSEIVGATALESDRFMRTLGIRRLAEGDADTLGDPARAAAEAYAAGVNAWIEGRQGSLPWELALLRVRPEPWLVADSMVWARLMGLRLSGDWGNELLRARLGAVLSPERLASLWPPYPADGATSIAALGLADAADPGGGSNIWAVSGAHTASGKPILANDPHLGLGVPNLWYLAHIEAPGFLRAGATVPGVPFHVLGHNGRLAWGMTTTHGDTADLFVERLVADAPGRYVTPDGDAAFETREETIGVRFGEAETLRVRATRHGPVISDVLRGGPYTAPDSVLALASAALQPGNRAAGAVYDIAAAADAGRAAAATVRFDSPQQNIAFADADGSIGMVAAGLVPVRRSGESATTPAPGWDGTHDWTGFVPVSGMPRVIDPPQGRIVNANNRVAPDDHPWFLGRSWDLPYRAARAEALLDATPRHTVEDSRRMQMDRVSPEVADLLPRMLALVQPADDLTRAIALLRGWDGDMARERPEPLIYTAWVRNMHRALFADDLGRQFDAWWRHRPLVLANALSGDGGWCDDVTTPERETCAAHAEAALRGTLADLAVVHGDDPADWRWGDAHRANFRHAAFGRVPVLSTLLNLRIGTGGGDFTLDRAGMDFDDPDDPFGQVHGAGFRAVYDLADLDASLFSLAVGQSGNPFSPHYDDQLETWRDGIYRRLEPPSAPAHTLRLRPAAPEGRMR